MLIYIIYGKWTSISFIRAYKRGVHYYRCIYILDLGKKHIKTFLIWHFLRLLLFYSLMSSLDRRVKCLTSPLSKLLFLGSSRCAWAVIVSLLAAVKFVLGILGWSLCSTSLPSHMSLSEITFLVSFLVITAMWEFFLDKICTNGSFW